MQNIDQSNQALRSRTFERWPSQGVRFGTNIRYFFAMDSDSDGESGRIYGVIDIARYNVQNSKEVAADIIAAYVSRNSVPASEIPALIAKVHATISGLSTVTSGNETGGAEVEKPTPSQIRKSIQYDGLISFIDGRSYKTLKRHLTAHGLDPPGYRERYGLPADYPVVAPSYAAQRSALAKAISLGVPGGRGDQRRTGTRG
jgi:predicted transcriptional regulator